MAILIFPPTTDWDDLEERTRNLARQFAKHGHQVFFCNLKPQQGSSLVKVYENLYLVNNTEYLCEKIIGQGSKDKAPIILWCSRSWITDSLIQFHPNAIVYDCENLVPEDLENEATLINRANVVFCASDFLLYRLTLHYGFGKIFYLRDGCDWESFRISDQRKFERPSDMPTSQEGIIGFIDMGPDQTDWSLVERVCRAHPGCQVVALGAEKNSNRLSHVANFTYIWNKSQEERSQYIVYFDLAILPYQINLTTTSRDPWEVYRYFAAGKPVVSIDFAEINVLQPLVLTGSDPEEFLNQVKSALLQQEVNVNERLEFAQNNTWEDRYDWVQKILGLFIPHFLERFEPLNIDLEQGMTEETIQCLFPVGDIAINNLHAQMNLDFDPGFIGRIDASIYRYLLRFDLKTVTRPIRKARLALYLIRCDNPNQLKCLEAHTVLNRWQETSVTWNGRPYFSEFFCKSEVFQSVKGWVEWDITPIVLEWAAQPEKNFGVLLKQQDEEGQTLVAAFNRHRLDQYSPKLKIYY